MFKSFPVYKSSLMLVPLVTVHRIFLRQCCQGPDRRTNFQPGPGPKPGPEPGPVLLLCTVQVYPTKIGS
jgi:hypothetical protein